MKICRREWLLAAQEASSYRRMFSLALMISNNPDATRTELRTAANLKAALEKVVMGPIAPAVMLQAARRRFAKLIDAVQAREHDSREFSALTVRN